MESPPLLHLGTLYQQSWNCEVLATDSIPMAHSQLEFIQFARKWLALRLSGFGSVGRQQIPRPLAEHWLSIPATVPISRETCPELEH